MLVDLQGRRIPPTQQSPQRNGMRVDLMELHPRARACMEASRKLQAMIRDDSQLRERIETADRMTGTKTIHLDILRGSGDGMDNKTVDALIKNQEFAEKVLIQKAEK